MMRAIRSCRHCYRLGDGPHSWFCPHGDGVPVGPAKPKGQDDGIDYRRLRRSNKDDEGGGGPGDRNVPIPPPLPGGPGGVALPRPAVQAITPPLGVLKLPENSTPALEHKPMLALPAPSKVADDERHKAR